MDQIFSILVAEQNFYELCNHDEGWWVKVFIVDEDKQPGFGLSQSLGKGQASYLIDLLKCYYFLFFFPPFSESRIGAMWKVNLK